MLRVYDGEMREYVLVEALLLSVYVVAFYTAPPRPFIYA
jgi:hypothetical protein